MTDAGDDKRWTNALINETSPYLLQHAHNPVEWHPWGESALEKARREDKPIFLSIGYSACHWCHVMERESFENERMAEVMNRSFVNIKVDREERPDLDDIYMHAVTAMTGQGGWPMSVFLTPDLKPFYGGTYFPPVPGRGMPGFRQVLEQIEALWNTRRDVLEVAAGKLTAHLFEQAEPCVDESFVLHDGLTAGAMRALEASFDRRCGGWGGAPKFPSSTAVSLALREHARTGNPAARLMAELTLDQMAWGGIHDCLSGGFHRYTVDADWLVPHFEKMLYDNAQLATAYVEAWQLLRRDDYRDVACGALDYLLRDMRDASGAFHSSEDADSGGEEGRYYLWTQEEIIQCLGKERGERFCQEYQALPNGNFASREPCHVGMNILHARRFPPEESREDLRDMRSVLLRTREQRERPGRDDKILTAWNALAISAFARAAQAFDSTRYLDAAETAGRFIRDVMWKEGVLMRVWRRGELRCPGYLEDYAFSANAFIDLYETNFDVSWLLAARELAEAALKSFYDEKSGIFYRTGDEHQHLLLRPSQLHDAAEPSGNAMAALALLRLALFFGENRYAFIAEGALRAAVPLVETMPMAALASLRAMDFLRNRPLEAVIAGDPGNADAQEMARRLHRRYIPNRVILWAGDNEVRLQLPLAASRRMIDDRATVYLCCNGTCFAPATKVNDLEGLLDNCLPGDHA